MTPLGSALSPGGDDASCESLASGAFTGRELASAPAAPGLASSAEDPEVEAPLASPEPAALPLEVLPELPAPLLARDPEPPFAPTGGVGVLDEQPPATASADVSATPSALRALLSAPTRAIMFQSIRPANPSGQ
jgi:hypothetical protein